MKKNAFWAVFTMAVLCAVNLTGCNLLDKTDENTSLPAAVEETKTEPATETADTDIQEEEKETMENNTEKTIDTTDSVDTEDVTQATESENNEEVHKDISEVDNRIAEVEAQEQEQYKKLEKEDITQREMNIIASTVYDLWNDQLNWMWGEMENKLDADTMNTLRTEQNEWIENRDREMKEAGLVAEGGTMQPLLEDSKGAEMTQARVNELAKWLR